MSDKKKPVDTPVVSAKSARESRTKARKAKNVALNEARKQANIAKIEALGGTYDPRATRPSTRTVRAYNPKEKRIEERVIQVRVSMGPAEQLRALLRAQNAGS